MRLGVGNQVNRKYNAVGVAKVSSGKGGEEGAGKQRRVPWECTFARALRLRAHNACQPASGGEWCTNWRPRRAEPVR